jgi:hypothetical protein
MEDPEWSWMTYWDTENVCAAFTDEGTAYMETFMWVYEGCDDDTGEEWWTEPVAYASDGNEDEEDTGVETAVSGVSAEISEVARVGKEVEPVRRVENFQPVSFVGTLDDALKWRPSEPIKVVKDVEVIEETVGRSREGSLEVQPLGFGWNCEVMGCVGELPTRVLLDGGASRNIIQKRFREALMANPHTKPYITGPHPGDRTISIAGIHADQKKSSANDITESYHLRLQFCGGDPLRATGRQVDMWFGEMESSSDALLIGCPQLAEWGFSLWRDEHNDRPKVELQKIGVILEMIKWKPNPELRGGIRTMGQSAPTA